MNVHLLLLVTVADQNAECVLAHMREVTQLMAILSQLSVEYEVTSSSPGQTKSSARDLHCDTALFSLFLV
jgi:hypothetical protein